jgi:hypothetical protein
LTSNGYLDAIANEQGKLACAGCKSLHSPTYAIGEFIQEALRSAYDPLPLVEFGSPDSTLDFSDHHSQIPCPVAFERSQSGPGRFRSFMILLLFWIRIVVWLVPLNRVPC